MYRKASSKPWTVVFHEAFETEFDDLVEGVQDELLAQAKVIVVNR